MKPRPAKLNEAKCDQLMELFYKVYDHTQTIQAQKYDIVSKCDAATREHNTLKAQKEKIEESMAGQMQDLNEQQAKNKALYTDNSNTLSSIITNKRQSEKTYDDIIALIDKKIEQIKQKAIVPATSSSSKKDDSNQTDGSKNRVPLSARDSDHLKQLQNVK